MPDDGGFFASHFFNSTKGGGASGNGFVSLSCSLQSCTTDSSVVGTSSEENGILIGRFLIHVVLTQWNVRLEKHDQKMDKKLVGQQGFPFRALEIRIVLISRYIVHIELVVRSLVLQHSSYHHQFPHSALKFAKKKFQFWKIAACTVCLKG